MACVCICFPGETTVTTDQGVKRMSELTSGDQVLTSSRTHGGSKWTKFYTWAHREPEASAEFLVLTVSSGHQIKISRNHLIFVVQSGRKFAKTAGQVCKGDKLLHMGEDGALEPLSIVEIRSEMLTGVYAPFTMSGHFLADGFLVGCYAEVANFDLAHAALAPLRTWHRMSEVFKGAKANKNGIHGYAEKLMKIRTLLPTSFQSRVN